MSSKNIRHAKGATITDVAKKAGVSIKTVSRVMNKEANVTEATAEKVQSAAKALNYEPNLSARMLAGSKSFSIGLIYENPHEFSYLKRVLDGIFDVCGKQGYSLLLKPCLTPKEGLLDEIQQFIKQTRVDGVILIAPLGDVPELNQYLVEEAIPFAQISPNNDDEHALVAHCDDQLAALNMTEHVIALGHRHIGFIKGHPDHGATDLRYQGYLQALKKHGIKTDEKLVEQGYFDFESGQRAGEKLLKQSPRPTAIIASNDDMAAGANFVARELKLDVPAELSITGFDDTPTAAHLWPPLTTVKQPITSMASSSTERLIAWIRGDAPTKNVESFHCELVIRRSTAKPPE